MGVEIRGTRDLICRCKKAEIRESHLEAKMEWQLKDLFWGKERGIGESGK